MNMYHRCFTANALLRRVALVAATYPWFAETMLYPLLGSVVHDPDALKLVYPDFEKLVHKSLLDSVIKEWPLPKLEGLDEYLDIVSKSLIYSESLFGPESKLFPSTPEEWVRETAARLMVINSFILHVSNKINLGIVVDINLELNKDYNNYINDPEWFAIK